VSKGPDKEGKEDGDRSLNVPTEYKGSVKLFKRWSGSSHKGISLTRVNG